MVSKVGSIQGQSDFLLTQKPNEGGKAQAFNCVAASGSKIKIRESIGFFFFLPLYLVLFFLCLECLLLSLFLKPG